MPERTFTLEEANTLLPVLESLLRQAMDSRQEIIAVDQEFQDLHHRIYIQGGMLLDVIALAARKAVKEKALQRIKDSIEEIQATGVQVKGIDVGLLDFPCVVEGDIVLLCWKFGEPHRIEHWHGIEEGFAGRKPIADLGLNRRRKDDTDRPN